MALNFIKRVLLGGFSTADSLEANFDDLETATADGLSRSGGSPNAMGADLDMNSNLILNLPQATSAGHAVEFSQFVAPSLVTEFTGYTVQEITATAGQTAFTLATAYTLGISAIRVYINGAYQAPSGYTETSTTVITFSSGLDAGDVAAFVHSSFTAAGAQASSAVTYDPGGSLPASNVQTALREFKAVGTLANDATPSVSAGALWETGGTTTITDFDDGTLGETIYIQSDHSITITDNASILLSGGVNYVMVSGDTLTLTMFDDQVWQEVARSEHSALYNAGDQRVLATPIGALVTGSRLQLDNSSAATGAEFFARNSEGGFLLLADGDIFTLFQIDSAGVVQDTWIRAVADGTVELYFNNTKEFETKSGGVIVDDELEINGALNHDGSTAGFYNTTPVSQQTGVAVTAAGIHAALVNLGLITA